MVWSKRGCQSLYCPIGIKRRESQVRAYKRRQEIRRPPTLPYSPDGTCRMCGGPVEKPKRCWCSPACVMINDLARFPRVARAHLLAFYPGCWQCSVITAAVHVDHVRPLWSLTPEERGELRWWLPFNLQLLCHDCHRAKTASEAAERAALT